MRPSYLLSLTKRAILANSAPHTNVAHTKLSVEQSLSGGLDSPNTTGVVTGVEGQRHNDCATPPGITQGRHLLLHPGTTTRIPDLEKVRFMQPAVWLEELRSPSLVLAVPNEFAAPRPVHARTIARENFSAIIDHEWEYREGSVRVVDTSQDTAIGEHSVSSRSWP